MTTNKPYTQKPHQGKGEQSFDKNNFKKFKKCIAFVFYLMYNILQKGGEKMNWQDQEIINKRLQQIAKYYSFENDKCSIDDALYIAIKHKIERIENETNNNKTR